ncbi:ABC transporter ATP-binding protein [Ligilactobacillus cholophilus]|uniref:ABC transporter ATP-binding protein n=1 Tax=Ligilactobacillus cholophilus TaxID=3050131 RepID=UPI0025B20875|nr:ABC transporter ATP-binding protein [Ligilactobacillus cholophilus]
MNILEINHLQKIYNEHQPDQVIALKDISFEVKRGDFIAIMGESGAGKSTLLNIIATLEQATSGQINLNGTNLMTLHEKDRARFRREHLGFIFQQFNLLDTLNNRDNIFLPLVLAKKKPEEMQTKLEPIAKNLNITGLLDRFPYEISGGQKQRVASARALITSPELLLADEPTGALDSTNSEKLLKLFQKINHSGQTILMVTHSPLAASYAQRTLFIKDGIIYHDLICGDQSQDDYLTKISTATTALLR